MAKELIRTLFVGLGGTGIRTILKIKSMFLEQFGHVPDYVHFLCIDTDFQGLRADYSGAWLEPAEAIFLSCPDAAGRYQNDKERFCWMPDKNAQMLGSSEGASLRSTARFYLDVNYDAVRHGIKRADSRLSAATGSLQKGLTQVNVVFSLCGATGSGCFLNIGYMLKEWFGTSAEVDAYAVGLIDSLNVDDYAAANMYGALRDADYIMSKISIDSPLAMMTGDGPKSYEYKPFDSFYVIDQPDCHYTLDDVCSNIGASLFYRLTIYQPHSCIAEHCYQLKSKMLWGDFDEGGKRAWIMGHGLCEIMIDREKLAEQFRMMAGMHLVSSIIGQEWHSLKMTESALAWVNRNKLCEHEADQLLDSLYDLSRLPQSVIASGKSAEARLESDTWVKDGEDCAVGKVNNAYSIRLDEIQKAIDEKISNIISVYGLNGAKTFVESLQSSFAIYEEEMKNELEALRSAQSVFIADKDNVLEAWKKTIFGGAGEYRPKLQDAQYELLKNKIDIMRHTKAQQFYLLLKEKLSSLDVKLNASIVMFSSVSEAFNKMMATLNAKKDVNPFVIDLSGSIPVTGDHPNNTVSAFIKSNPNLLEMASLSADEVTNKFIDFTSSLNGTDFGHVSLEKQILSMDEKERCKLFEGELYRLCDNSKNQLINCYISVPTGQLWDIIKKPELRSLFECCRIEHVELCSSPLQSSILIYVHKGGSIAARLDAWPRCQMAFERLSERASFSFDKMLEQKIHDENYVLTPGRECNRASYSYMHDYSVNYSLEPDLREQISRDNTKIHGLRQYVSKINGLSPVPKGQIAAARDFSIVLNDNGHQTLVGRNDDYCQLYSNDRIVKVAAAFCGYLGLTEQGEILTCGIAREFRRSEYIEKLSGVKDIAACEGHTLVLYADGTVESIDEPGSLTESTPSHNSIVTGWRNIKQMAVGYSNVMGLTEDGKVLYHRGCQGVDANFYDKCSNVVQLDCFSCYYGNEYSAVLHDDGTVTSDTFSEVKEWKDIIQIAVGDGVAVGLKSNGQVEVTEQYYDPRYPKYTDVRNWRNVVSVECKFRSVVGITKDGDILS